MTASRARCAGRKAPPGVGDERLRVGERVGRRQAVDPACNVGVVAGGLHCRGIVRLEGPDEQPAVGEPRPAEIARSPLARSRARVAGQHGVHGVIAPALARRPAAQDSLANEARRRGDPLRADVVEVGADLEALDAQLVEGPVTNESQGGGHDTASPRPGCAPVADLADLCLGVQVQRDRGKDGVVGSIGSDPEGIGLRWPSRRFGAVELVEIRLCVGERRLPEEPRRQLVVERDDHGRLVLGPQGPQSEPAVGQLRRLRDLGQVSHRRRRGAPERSR